MDFTLLTPQQRESFDQDGFLRVPQVLTPDQVKELIVAGDRLAQPLLQKPPLQNKPEYNQLDLRPGLLNQPAMLSLVAWGQTVGLLVQLLGPNIHLHSTALIYKRPEDPSAPPFRRGWHRDMRVAPDLGHQHLPRVGVKVCYCLTDFTQAQCGMTLMARGSHVSGHALAIHQGRVDPHEFEVCDIRANAGDAILFENRIFHTAAPNRSDRTSKVVMFGYAYRWMKQETYLDNLAARFSSQVDPITWQLLGGYHDVDTQPWALSRWAQQYHVLPEPVAWTQTS